MFDDLQTYYSQHVVESFVKYRKAKYSSRAGRNEDLRLAVAAAEALFHLHEHLPRGMFLTRKELEGRCADFRLLADVANVTKHKTLDRRAPLVTDAAQISEQVVITEYHDEIGVYRRSGKEVVVRLNDGSERDLFDVLISVINFWESYLQSHGLLKDARIFKRQDEPEPRVRFSPDMDDDEFLPCLMRGERHQMGFAFRRYNYEAGIIEPVDLTGRRLSFTAHTAPPRQLDIVLTHQGSGRERRVSVALSTDDELHLFRLNNDEARNKYLQSLPRVQEAFQEFARQQESLESELTKSGSQPPASPDASD